MKTSKKSKLSGPSIVGKITDPIPKHVHIPIKHGHITWTGEKPPVKRTD